MDNEYRKVDLEKAKNLFSDPNELKDLLDDLESYESYSNTDELYNSIDGDRLKVVKHEPYEDAEKVKKASKEDNNSGILKQKVDTLEDKELQDLLESTDALEYLGLE